MELYIVQFIALFLLALVTGVFWGPWLSLHRSLEAFSAADLIHIVKTMAKNLAVPMRILMPCCVLFMTLSTWFYPHINSLGFYFSIAACFLTIIALIITIRVEVPIVNDIKNWTHSTKPNNWEAIRNRWKFFHVIRTFVSLTSFGSFAISLLFLIK